VFCQLFEVKLGFKNWTEIAHFFEKLDGNCPLSKKSGRKLPTFLKKNWAKKYENWTEIAQFFSMINNRYILTFIL